MLLLTLLGCAEPPPLVAPAPDPFALRRLNRSEYQRTLRDLLGAEVPMATQLPPDDSASRL